MAVVLGLVALAFAIARKKGWLPSRHRPGHGHHHEPGAPPPGPPGPGEALRILDERLARGEIEIADYQARRAALTGASYPPFQQPPPSPPTPPGGPAPTREEPQPPVP
jgi:putative membrane protein